MSIGAEELKRSLQALRARNADGFTILSAVSGVDEKRITAIADGGEPSLQEQIILSSLADG